MLAAPGVLALDDLARGNRKMGPHLFECSGNANPSNFGLMSVAEWEGVPLAEIVARLKPTKEATAVLVSGFDHIGQVSQRSIVGASWVYPLASLDRLGAFFATRMNGEPLPADHGKPVRLVVPGWYGCSWIKWVNEIRLVGPDEPATTQMVEFAGRTHQTDPHKFARDYAPADIQTAATPVRVEKRKRRQRARIPHRRHRVGRREADRSTGDPHRQRGRLRAVLGLPDAEDAHDVVAVGIPLEARGAGDLRHRAKSRGRRGAAAPTRFGVLRQTGQDRGNLDAPTQRAYCAYGS